MPEELQETEPEKSPLSGFFGLCELSGNQARGDASEGA